jgi:hypothetical protein
MNGSEMLSFLRATTGTDEANYTTANAMVDLNISYHFIEDAIVKKVGEKFFWDRLDATGVSEQSEYTFYSATSGNLTGVNKTYGVSVDYGGT